MTYEGFGPTIACFFFLSSVMAGGGSSPGGAVQCRTTNPVERFPARLSKVLDVLIGEDTVATVKQKLGEATNVHVSESQGSAMCYRLDRGDDRTYVIFDFGPLGGFNRVTGYRVSTSAGGKIEERCAMLKDAHKLELANGLRLGMTKAEFKSALGGNACEREKVIQYSYKGKRRMNSEELARFSERNPGAAEDPFFDVRADISGGFDRSGLTELAINMTESY